ncbi:MAG: S8 family serine peptidase, partial [Terracidiphilus sp.]
PTTAEPFYYPAEDDYVTTVGGTSLVTNGAGGTWASETAWSDSGGGISPDAIPIPSWQAGVANVSNQGSTIYRNVPDVAMEGNFDNYACDMGVCAGDWGGTSFAAPRWAAYVALANQQAAEAGNTAIGFLNPIVYPLAESAPRLTIFTILSVAVMVLPTTMRSPVTISSPDGEARTART